jgi:hypothetical protein
VKHTSTPNRARAIAFYLPQYHPVPENDEWWGKGFTEWTNVGRAKPLYRGHYQPRVPADLGYYDLRVAETREAQARMARAHGVEAFCYWHYWFAGERLLERPMNEVLASGEPDFPFCLAWANASWTGIWYGAPKRVLKAQTYPGPEDHRRHFESLLPAFTDRRYVTVDGKPLFTFFRPNEIPDLRRTADQWHEMAIRAGLKGLHLVGIWGDGAAVPKDHGFDAVTLFKLHALFDMKLERWRDGFRRWFRSRRGIRKVLRTLHPRPLNVYRYEEAARYFVERGEVGSEYYPTVIPNFDNTARSGLNGFILDGSTPEAFRPHLRQAIERVQELPPDRRIVFIKSWNEWAEGNYLEPDLRFGTRYLDVLREEISVDEGSGGGGIGREGLRPQERENAVSYA